MSKGMTELHYAMGLTDLCERMNKRSGEEAEARAKGQRFQAADFSRVPNFGGMVPRDTRKVWSWDPSHLIVPDGTSGNAFKIVSREDNRLEHVPLLRSQPGTAKHQV